MTQPKKTPSTATKVAARPKAAPKPGAQAKAASDDPTTAKSANPKPAAKAAPPAKAKDASAAPKARLTISSKNYSSWSLRGWLICKLAGLPFVEATVSVDDPSTRAELLLMSPTNRVPRLVDGEVDVWDTWAIAAYLHETRPQAGMYPEAIAARAHCRAVCGEMHSGFANLRSALPFNVKGRYPGFKIWAGAQADIDHLCDIWRDCLARYGGPFLFGAKKSVADAMFAPVCSRFVTYDVALDPACAAYRDLMMGQPEMQEWIAAAQAEPDEMEELDVEF